MIKPYGDAAFDPAQVIALEIVERTDADEYDEGKYAVQIAVQSTAQCGHVLLIIHEKLTKDDARAKIKEFLEWLAEQVNTS